ncbi:long chain base biosynthesis protein 1-like isoform X1 [Malus sylvestris]|uniref:long chain base biosynthesis protein 1-like isoform X1 n=1 Tax=Malus sylvestris TaxID=3752 RepID=UPI0021AC200E|nr:long chain base biosynthesis protein 1-like isoform X1 [Malus sylvestris]
MVCLPHFFLTHLREKRSDGSERRTHLNPPRCSVAAIVTTSAVSPTLNDHQNSGQIASLDKIVELKEKYKLHVLLDESNSFGVLGKTGRGLTEYCGIPVFLESLLFFQYLVEKIDVITAAMGHALATEGGFCTGSARVTYRQVVART